MLTSLHPKTSIAAGLCASRLCASRHLMTGQPSPSGRRAQIPLSCPLASALGSILTFGFCFSLVERNFDSLFAKLSLVGDREMARRLRATCNFTPMGVNVPFCPLQAKPPHTLKVIKFKHR